MENKEYISEFCTYNGIFHDKPISQTSINKISYNFGVDPFYLHGIKNIEQLDETIKKHSSPFPPILEDINSELLQMLSLQKID